MIPMLIETLLSLKEYLDSLSIKDITEALHRVKENGKQKRTDKKLHAHEEEEAQISAGAFSMVMYQNISPMVYDEDNSK